MKSGTSQKLVLNMITTSLMIRLGHIKGNKMVDMQLNNDKLVNRGVRYLIDELVISTVEAEALLTKFGSVRKAIKNYQT
jgi:N-acetylmuramic acid 6-phosphate etherase